VLRAGVLRAGAVSAAEQSRAEMATTSDRGMRGSRTGLGSEKVETDFTRVRGWKLRGCRGSVKARSAVDLDLHERLGAIQLAPSMALTAGGSSSAPPSSAPATPPAPGAAGSAGGWPIRPRLTLLLLGAMLVVVAGLVATYRGEATVPTKLAGMIGLGPKVRMLPPPMTVVVADQSDLPATIDEWANPESKRAEEAGTLDGFDPTLIAEDKQEAWRQRLESAKRPVHRFIVTAGSLERTGWLAPTSVEVKGSIASDHLGTATVRAADEAAARAELADFLKTRTAWKPFALLVEETDAKGAGTGLVHSSRVTRGYFVSAVVFGVLVTLVMSLMTTANGLHRSYDKFAATMTNFGGAAVLGLLWTASPAILGVGLLVYLEDVSKLLLINPQVGWFGYVCVFIVSAGLGFLPTYGQSFLGGWVFGFAIGFPGAMLGFVGGSVIGYYIAQRVSRDKVTSAFEANPKAAKLRKALIGRGFWRTFMIVTLVRIPPNSPFALTNLLLASSGVGLLPYVLGTAIGMAPRTGIAVYLAAKGASTGARNIADFLENQPAWVWLAGIGIFVVVLAILGWIGNRALHEVTKDDAV